MVPMMSVKSISGEDLDWEMRAGLDAEAAVVVGRTAPVGLGGPARVAALTFLAKALS